MTLHRRGWLSGAFATLGAMALSACNKINASPRVQETLAGAEGLTLRAQRAILSGGQLAREFEAKDISPAFKANGTRNPQDPAYQALVASGFADWKLVVDGLVERPLALSLAELRALPARTQITRHDCVEGWSCIGKWTGAKLAPLLEKAGLKPQAKYIVLHCADTLDPNDPKGGLYYESIDLVDAFHPQTILAYAMNDAPLPVAHGAPIRLRAERHLGYKQAKYVMRLEAVSSFAHLGHGKGGFWEDRGYEWYGGI